MTKKTMRNIQAGDVVITGYGDIRWKAKFLGFTNNYAQYDRKPVYDNAGQMLKARGVISFKRLEEMEDKREYGYFTYAIFQSLEDGDAYAAYLYKGRWCLGTSADPMVVIDWHE